MRIDPRKKEQILRGNTEVLREVLNAKREVVQGIVNTVKDDHRFHQGELKGLNYILNLLDE